MAEITSKLTDGLLTIYLSGDINSDSAPQTEKDIQAAQAADAHTALVMDVENLRYTSSAGLRVFLRTCKSEKDFKIIGASTEVYEIFEMTGFTEVMTIEKAYRRVSIEGCEVIGKGAKGAVYRLNGDTIVKVYLDPESLDDIHRERQLAREAFVLGIPTAISYDVVKVGDSYGSVFELLDAASYTKLIKANPDKVGDYAADFGKLLHQIHETPIHSDLMADAKNTGRKWAKGVQPYLPAEAGEKLVRLVEEAPDTGTMIHGDFHTNNVMVQDGEALLIDMDTLSYGHPVFELGNICFSYVTQNEIDPEGTQRFFGLGNDICVEFWNKFFPVYLGTDDPEKIAYAEDRVKLMAYARQMRHVVRRVGPDSDEGKLAIEYCGAKIIDILSRVDSLDL